MVERSAVLAALERVIDPSSGQGLVSAGLRGRPGVDAEMMQAMGGQLSLTPATLGAMALIVLTVALLLGMVLKYVTDTTELGVTIAGPVHGVVFDGRRYDTGDRLDYIKANVLLALDRDDLGPDLRAWLTQLIAS